MKVEVISLGGSVIMPNKIDVHFLKEFKKTISKFKDRKFVIVVGGGNVSRDYIGALKKLHVAAASRSKVGIDVTRLNARFVLEYFDGDANADIPYDLKEVKSLIKSHRVVLCGGLKSEKESTSDGTAAEIAKALHTEFVNITNVKGLFDKDPKKFKNVKFIKRITFSDFDKIISKLKYEPGQHFVLDQKAAEIINKENIRTIILGKNLKNFESYLRGKKFVGTIIY